MNREVKQKTNEGKKNLYQGGGETRFFGSFQHKQNQTKIKPKKKLRRIQGSGEVAQRATSLDP